MWFKNAKCVLTKIQGSGISSFEESKIELIQTRIVDNAGSAICLHDESVIKAIDCDMRENVGGDIQDKTAVSKSKSSIVEEIRSEATP